MGRVDIGALRGYKLVLSRLQPEWRQLSFADIVSEWPVLSDPIRMMQYERLVLDIVDLECPTHIMFIAQGIFHRDDGGGITVFVEDEKAHIIFSGLWNEK